VNVPSSRPLLAATLIVKDEAERLPACLASLQGVVDEIVVHDTGSTDGTQELARRAGARVHQGTWHGDFAMARNIALDLTEAEWSLVVDADERLVADPTLLRRVLTTVPHQVTALQLKVDDIDGQGRFQAAHLSLRIARTRGARWTGRVHELLRLAPPDARQLPVSPGIAHVVHTGYADAVVVRAKAERNLVLAQAELDDLQAGGSEDREAGCRILLDLARSAVETGRGQLAVDALETIRELVADGPYRSAATGLLAQVLLDAGGHADVVLVLEAELRTDPTVHAGLPDWLAAQALASLGDPEEALRLLRGIDRVIDATGIELPYARVLRARARLAAAMGRHDEARSVLLTLLENHGIADDDVELLQSLPLPVLSS
jgi:predicted Zn-dependent protease